MDNSTQFFSLQGPISSAQSILVVLPKEPSFDRVAAGLALFLSLGKMGKLVSIISPQEMTVEFSSLVGVDKIKSKPEGRNLTVSFDYIEDSIEKVSYNIEGGRFNLVIQPKEEFPPLSADKVQYSYSGGKADLIIAIEVNSSIDLGSLYDDNPRLFNEGKVINFNIEGAASISDRMTKLISSLNLSVDVDIANNLLRGIERATDNFSSPNTNADTFEAVAFCLRWGAQRIGRKFTDVGKPGQKFVSKTISPKTPVTKFFPEPDKKGSDKAPSPDWLEPKIYKGNTHI